MKMKIKQIAVLAVLLYFALPTFAAQTAREDINPALLYWQAFALMPDLGPEDQKYLLETPWRTRPMDQRAGQLTTRFDNTFKLLRAATETKANCDWGVDLANGPEAIFPHLAKAKRCAEVANLRARWALQQGQPENAARDLVAAFVLGRNISRDRTLVSALVQIALERIVMGHLVQQWPVFPTRTIGEVLAGFDRAPSRGTIADTLVTERTAFYGWLERRVRQIQKEQAGNERVALQEVTKLLDGIVSNEGRTNSFGASVVSAAGNTMPGFLAYLGQVEPLYQEFERTMALPYSEFWPAMDQLQKKVSESDHLLVQEFFPALLKARDKEFRTIAWLAMIHAAYEIRLDPTNGPSKNKDPFGSGPFAYSRFVQDGKDRGFQLKSAVKNPDFPETLIFIDKSGPAIFVDGPFSGQLVK